MKGIEYQSTTTMNGSRNTRIPTSSIHSFVRFG